jgi:protein-L-isoaspartate(D-aspartate) O-methyltransferase
VNESAIAELRARLVRELLARGDLRSARIVAAFERVPRHLFLPQFAPEDVYIDRSIAIKLDGDVPLSSSSQPAIMAAMLEMLAMREGEHVLEIGTGSGYNAALLAELAGPNGSVTTIDIDAELVAAARLRLDETGYARVRTVVGDGAEGNPSGAPFDAIIATVGVDRIPPAWKTQLRVGGNLVAPLTIRKQQKVIAYERMPDGLEAFAAIDAAFIMLRGPWVTRERFYQ